MQQHGCHRLTLAPAKLHLRHNFVCLNPQSNSFIDAVMALVRNDGPASVNFSLQVPESLDDNANRFRHPVAALEEFGTADTGDQVSATNSRKSSIRARWASPTLVGSALVKNLTNYALGGSNRQRGAGSGDVARHAEGLRACL